MNAIVKTGSMEQTTRIVSGNDSRSVDTAISNSWKKIAPFWPLKNLIAVNPAAGFEDLKFEDGLRQANVYFQQKELPVEMQQVNRESIKWLQAFFDQGQSTIRMPLRNRGLLKSVLSLIRFDKPVHKNHKQKIQWLENLPQSPDGIIAETLSQLGIQSPDQEQFLTLMLTTLPGWAAHVQYRTNWADAQDAVHPHPVTQAEYLALRLVLTSLIWPGAKELLRWHRQALQKADTTRTYSSISGSEITYQQGLVQQLKAAQAPQNSTRADAQLVFCIDVRSEPFRRALETQGNYETYGFAGFFGVPVSIENTVTGESYASCPVLLKPAYQVKETPDVSHQTCRHGHDRLQGIRKLYQSLKYTFTTPFSLVEAMGLASGLWMGVRSLSPQGAASLRSAVKRSIAKDYTVTPDITGIPIGQQVAFGSGALKMMGLTENFAPLVVLCGHGSTTENNAYATALDCGACGGRHGAPNARILATILNNREVRTELKKQQIEIPGDTLFLAAEHNTTTDEVEIYSGHTEGGFALQVQKLRNDLELARNENSCRRSAELGVKTSIKEAGKATALRAKDWAQVRPEWGLAGNAAFIVGPRWLTRDVNLEGRSFLHSYEWEKDNDGSSLTTILTAPMVVAQWINAQYFFSTLDNVAFGGGSKVTKNITGKIGIMQGNASDLMHGLPLQSVYRSDDEPYHQLMRLTVVVYAPKERIEKIVHQHAVLQKLFGNGWVHMICFDPREKKQFQLNLDLTWAHFG
ncbi:MAG: DUF2309 domain-containing protein [Chitinophagaceae bacterium]|nr:DUF2309 domain-containing protein [Chitinophagaceae bacterium]